MGTRGCKRREDVDKIKILKMQCDRKNDKIRTDERERDKCKTEKME